MADSNPQQQSLSDQNVREAIKKAFELGIAAETAKLLVAFCVKHNKETILAQLQSIIKAFEESLTPDELKKFQSELEASVDRRIEELAENLAATYPPQEVDQILSELQIATAS